MLSARRLESVIPPLSAYWTSITKLKEFATCVISNVNLRSSVALRKGNFGLAASVCHCRGLSLEESR